MRWAVRPWRHGLAECLRTALYSMRLRLSCRASHQSPLSSSADALIRSRRKMPENRCLGPTCLYPAAQRATRGSLRRMANLASIAGVIVGLTVVSPQAQTLTDALAEAYNTNPQLLAQRALLRATDEQVPQALSFWRPQVTFTGQIGLATASLEAQPGAAA